MPTLTSADHSGDQGCAEDEDNRPKVVLIMGESLRESFCQS